MHGLKVQRYYVDRPESPIRTFPLPGIRDSPPHVHDGRCLTFHGTEVFLNLLLKVKLNSQEKEDFLSSMLALQA